MSNFRIKQDIYLNFNSIVVESYESWDESEKTNIYMIEKLKKEMDIRVKELELEFMERFKLSYIKGNCNIIRDVDDEY